MVICVRTAMVVAPPLGKSFPTLLCRKKLRMLICRALLPVTVYGLNVPVHEVPHVSDSTLRYFPKISILFASAREPGLRTAKRGWAS